MMKAFVLALFGLTAVVSIAAIPAAAQSVAAEQTVTFTVENMTCALCPFTVKRAMEGVEGVTAVGHGPLRHCRDQCRCHRRGLGQCRISSRDGKLRSCAMT